MIKLYDKGAYLVNGTDLVPEGEEEKLLKVYGKKTTKEEALKKALELIPEGSTIGMGGAMSAHEIGLVDALKNGDYKFIDRDNSPGLGLRKQMRIISAISFCSI